MMMMMMMMMSNVGNFPDLNSGRRIPCLHPLYNVA